VKTTPEDFAFYAKRAMRLLAEDAIAELQTSPITIQTPCVDQFEGTAVVDKNQICAVSIVRAGDSLLEAVRECLPGVPVGKILIQRDEESPGKEAKLFYAKMPPGVKDMTIILCDPMLATGGSAMKAIETLVSEFGVSPSNILFANMICCPEGLLSMATAYPQIKIVTACIDECLNDQKYIVPGLGDYGDRFFNT